MNRADMSRQVLLWDQLAAAAKDRSAALRQQLQTSAAEEYAAQGMAPTWRLPGVGTVSMPVTQDQIVVVDEAALCDWVERRTPALVETIRRVQPNHLANILANTVAADGVVLDPATGEVVPGLEARAGGQPLALRFKPSGEAQAVARMSADGLLERFEAAFTGEVEQ